MTADLGSVPEWIGGLGTTAATILLAVGWWRESKLRREDRQRQAAITIRQLNRERLPARKPGPAAT